MVNMPPRWPTVTPIWSTMLPRYPQDGPRQLTIAQNCLKTAQYNPRWAQDSSIWQQLPIRWSSDLLSHVASKSGRKQRRSLQIIIYNIHTREELCQLQPMMQHHTHASSIVGHAYVEVLHSLGDVQTCDGVQPSQYSTNTST
jgi:hypothetical protein